MTAQEAIYYLKERNISKVRLEYSGGGDSGSIEQITYIDDNDKECTGIDTDVTEAIENFAYTKLNDIEDWWNNDGGMGYMIIDLDDHTYEISNEIRYTDYETYNHEGKLSELLKE